MSEASSAFPRAFAVCFKDFDRWDPVSFHGIHWYWPHEFMKPIGSVLKIRKEKVDRSIFSFGSLQPITIHFDGSIDKREVDPNREYSMDLYFARPGDIVVAKIDLKNGAVGIIPDNWKNVVVTGHFAVYESDRSQLIPEYLHLIIQTSFFKSNLWRNKVGAEGRKEVKLDFFEAEKIPLPPLFIQEAIVKHWENAQKEIVASRNKADTHALEIENALLHAIGVRVLPPTPRNGALGLSWRELERWDTFFYRSDFVDLESQLSGIKSLPLGELLNFISRPWKKEDFPNGIFEYIEISSVTKQQGIISSRTVDAKNAPSRATTLIKTGDIIIATTRPYLGAFAIVPDKYDGCVCSSGFALADGLKLDGADKNFIIFFLKSTAGLKQMERRMTGGLYPAIVQNELNKVKIPLPPINIQHEIVQKIDGGNLVIKRERDAAVHLATEIKKDVEALILGTKKLDGCTNYA